MCPSLAAYSCRDSCGLGASPAPHSRLRLLIGGTDAIMAPATGADPAIRRAGGFANRRAEIVARRLLLLLPKDNASQYR